MNLDKHIDLDDMVLDFDIFDYLMGEELLSAPPTPAPSAPGSGLAAPPTPAPSAPGSRLGGPRRGRGRPRTRPRKVVSHQPLPPRVFSTGGDDRKRRVRQRMDTLKIKILEILPTVDEQVLNFIVAEETLYKSLSDILDNVWTQNEMFE
jgi:hypothetical protein